MQVSVETGSARRMQETSIVPVVGTSQSASTASGLPASASSRISHGDHRLIAAARDGDVKKIRRLLQKHRVNVNARDPSTGNTALMVASLIQDPDAISALLEGGADPTLHNYTGQNCLDSLPASLVQFVLHSPDTVLFDCAGIKGDEKRLLLASWSGDKEEVLRLLTQTSVDVNCTNAEGSTPLTLLCRDLHTFQELHAIGVIRSYDPLAVIQILLDHGVLVHRDVNHQDRQGRTCLHYASHTSCQYTASVVGMLLQNGAKVDMKDKHGFHPLHFASQAGSVEAVRLLLDSGADPSAAGLGAITPLHLAASAGNLEAVVLLLDRGADVLSFASDGKSPLCCAGNQDVYALLRRAVEQVLSNGGALQASGTAASKQEHADKKKLGQILLQQQRNRHPPRQASGDVTSSGSGSDEEEGVGVEGEEGEKEGSGGGQQHQSGEKTDGAAAFVGASKSSAFRKYERGSSKSGSATSPSKERSHRSGGGYKSKQHYRSLREREAALAAALSSSEEEDQQRPIRDKAPRSSRDDNTDLLDTELLDTQWVYPGGSSGDPDANYHLQKTMPSNTCLDPGAPEPAPEQVLTGSTSGAGSGLMLTVAPDGSAALRLQGASGGVEKMMFGMDSHHKVVNSPPSGVIMSNYYAQVRKSHQGGHHQQQQHQSHGRGKRYSDEEENEKQDGVVSSGGEEEDIGQQPSLVDDFLLAAAMRVPRPMGGANHTTGPASRRKKAPPPQHLSRMKLTRELQRSLTGTAPGSSNTSTMFQAPPELLPDMTGPPVKANYYYYCADRYKRPPSNNNSGAHSDDESLYMKAPQDDRPNIVRPPQPPARVSSTAATSAAKTQQGGSKGAASLMSKFFPPWITRSGDPHHLSSASWVYLPQCSPEDEPDMDSNNGAFALPSNNNTGGRGTNGSQHSGDSNTHSSTSNNKADGASVGGVTTGSGPVVVSLTAQELINARSSMSLSRKEVKQRERSPQLSNTSAGGVGVIQGFSTLRADSSVSRRHPQLPPGVKIIDAPQTLSNARRAKGSTARPGGLILAATSSTTSTKDAAKLSGLHSDPKAVIAPKTLSEIPAFPGGPPFPWIKGKLIGKGAFGLVWCGLNANGELVAVKQFQLPSADQLLTGGPKATQTGGSAQDDVLSAVQLEVDILQSLKHTNIVGFLGVQQDAAVINLFLEYVSGGTLSSNLAQFGAFPESVVQRYARQLFQATAYLHSRQVIHRDIKGNNVMVCPGTGTIKLIDFGCACFEPSATDCERLVASARGTPYWMAPEVICQQQCSHKSDIWSCGCTLIEMFQTKPPWYELSPLAAAFAIGQGTSEPKLPEGLSANACDIIHLCLNRSAHERPSAEEVLQHLFLQTGEIESTPS